MVRYFDFERYHGKANIGSTKLRVHNMIKYWPEAGLYKYGEKPDVLIFQKVYATADYKFPINFPGLKILDICDADWLDMVAIKETVDAMDAVVCSTEPIQEFIQQLTDKPVIVIKDRHDIELAPEPKVHDGELKKLIWFGFRHNADCLKPFIRQYEDSGYELMIISNEDPIAERWAMDHRKWQDRIKFVPFDWETLYSHLQTADVALLPEMYRPQDKYKSNNRTVLCWLAGLPVIKEPEDFEKYRSAKERNQASLSLEARKDYDIRQSIKEMQALIEVLYAKADAQRTETRLHQPVRG